MSQLSHSQEPPPAFGTDHAASDMNNFFKSFRDLTDYRQTLLSLLQDLDANGVCSFFALVFFCESDPLQPEATNEDRYPSESPVSHGTMHITRPETSKENPIQTKTEPFLTQQEITKTKEKGKEKEKGTFPDYSSPFPLLGYLQRFASHERFDFGPIRDHEVDPFPSLDRSGIYAGSFFDDHGSWGNVCDTTSSNAIAGPSSVTLDDLERSERRLY